MPTIKIDDKDYDFDTLSQEAKDQLTSLQFVDNELIRLNAQVAVYSTEVPPINSLPRVTYN